MLNIMSLTQTLGVFNKVLDRIDKAASGKLEVSRADATLFSANGSIIKLLSTFIIEPTVIVAKDLREEEIIEKLIETNIDVFSSFYIQAFNVITNVYGFNQEVAFDILSSGGSVGNKYSNKKAFVGAFEDIDTNENDILILPTDGIGMEAKKIDYKEAYSAAYKKMMKAERNVYELKKDNVKMTAKMENNKNIKQIKVPKASISEVNKDMTVMINKYIDITYTLNASKNGVNETTEIIIPVLIKANIIYTDFINIENLLEVSSRDKKFVNRLDEYRASAITLKDFLFAGDLITAYKKNKLKDKDALLSHLSNRTSRANSKLLTSNAIGFSKYYSMLIISKRQEAIIEHMLGGKLSKPKYLDMLMEQSKSLIVDVVDTNWERVVLYTKDLRGSTDITYKTLKKRKGDKDNSELVEIFKAITTNRQPSF